MKNWFKILFKSLAYLAFLFLSVLFLLEVVYRYQLIDFYKTEITALNTSTTKDKPVDLLVFGDSFSAQHEGYISLLRKTFPNKTIINAAIPGTSSLQASFIAKRRLDKFNPKHVLFQVYVGNDLIDIDFLKNWKSLSFARNAYWTFSEYFRILPLLNYKFGQLKHIVGEQKLEISNDRTEAQFSISTYSPRTRLYLKSNSNYLTKQINLTGKSGETIKKLIHSYDEIIKQLPPNTSYSFLIIPHCTQTSVIQTKNYKTLGAHLPHQLPDTLYPFLNSFTEHYGDEKVINPLPYLQDQEKDAVLCYYNNDPHLSHQGNLSLVSILKKWMNDL